MFRMFDGITWALNEYGVVINGVVQRTKGEPATARRVLGWYGSEIAAASAQYGVEPALIIATICTEAAGGQTDKARVDLAERHEPGFASCEATPSRVSIGPMQTLLSTARYVLYKQDLTADDLRRPEMAIKAGTAMIASQKAKTNLNPPMVAAAYNAGGLYPDSGANRWRMRCYPLGTGAHIDRFVQFYGDALAALKEQPAA